MNFRELHAFADPALLEQALTHPSYSNEHPGAASNQRLEFLGDAVLQLVVSELLLDRYPAWDEGRLTKARARLVDRRQCTALAERIGLAQSLRADRRLSAGGTTGSKVLADAFEALVAAIYKDAGLEGARAALAMLLTPLLPGLSEAPLTDTKSRLLEWCQARRLPSPVYVEGARSGPDHARVFAVTVSLGDRAFGPGIGTSKKTAEVAAATLALASLEGDVSAGE